MDSVAEEILREILLTLPTRDVARGRCVSRRWRCLLTDPSFIELHARSAHVVSGASAEAVLISETRPPGKSPVTTVFNASMGNKNHTCCIAGLAPGYSPANVCNGFICLAAAVAERSRQPVFLCNPITGDTVQVQPPPRSGLNTHWHMYGMGYSPSTRQYKLFRFSFSVFLSLGENVLHVLTLGSGGDGMWRRHQGSFHCHGMRSPPALIDGKLYVLGKTRDHDRKPNRLLVVGVASETYHTYHLTKYNAEDAVADVLELRSRLCVAVHELGPWRRWLCFWVVLPLAPHGHGGCRYLAPLSWELRYSLEMVPKGAHIINSHHHPRAALLDGNDGHASYR